jgi:DNA-binding PadR family transcriptional regulator
MGELTNAEAALLGLLSEEARYPYQIEQEVKYRDMRFWTELSMSAIYKLLRKLEKEGLVTSNNEISAENRLRKLYEISETGKIALKEKIKKLLSEPEHIRWQFDIGIYNADLLPKAQVREALGKYRTVLEENIKGYNDLLKFLQDSGCPAHRLTIATRPVYLLRAEMAWVEDYLGGER